MTLSCLVTRVGAVIATFPGQSANPQDSSAHSGCRRRLAAPAQAGDRYTRSPHLTITALDKAIAFPVRFGQDISNGARQTRFFGNKQPH